MITFDKYKFNPTMKQFILLCLTAILVLFSNNTLAKDLKINITALGSPLAYSYVYVNGDAKAVANSMGVASIPLSWLDEGDVISASFVGFNGAETVYNSEISTLNEITLNLTTNFVLDEVVVNADIGKIYRKFIKKWTTEFRQKDFKMVFNVSKHIDSVDLKCSGQTVLTYAFRSDSLYNTLDKGKRIKRQTFYPLSPRDTIRRVYKEIDYVTIGDTMNVINNIAYSHHFHLTSFNGIDNKFRMQSPPQDTSLLSYYTPPEVVKYAYLGIIDGYRAFTISEGDDISGGQYIFYFDRNNGVIKKIKNVTLVYNANKEIIRKYASELDMGYIKRSVTIISFKDITENFETKNNFVVEGSIKSVKNTKKKNMNYYSEEFKVAEGIIIDNSRVN